MSTTAPWTYTTPSWGALPATPAAATKPRAKRPRRAWPRIFLGGLLLWVVVTVVTVATSNGNLVPTVLLLGSFLVPVTVVTYAFEHRTTDALGEWTILLAFLAGGILATVCSTVLEALLVEPFKLAGLAGVGPIEEGCKLAALWLVVRKLVTRDARDGVVLGAAVGFGFAAFETAGYAFTALFAHKGVGLGYAVGIDAFRGLLAPFGHGLWTAIVGGLLLRGDGHLRARRSWGLLGCYLLVSLLHSAWDASIPVAGALGLLVLPVDVALGILALVLVWRRRRPKPAIPAAVQYGLRSRDGLWWWDGRQWQPVLQVQPATLHSPSYGLRSQDGRWWWDDRRWQPVAA